MDNKPNGRGKKIIGSVDSVHKKGEGLNTGKPVGKDVSYSKRPQSGSSSFSGGSHSGSSGSRQRKFSLCGRGMSRFVSGSLPVSQ